MMRCGHNVLGFGSGQSWTAFRMLLGCSLVGFGQNVVRPGHNVLWLVSDRTFLGVSVYRIQMECFRVLAKLGLDRMSFSSGQIRFRHDVLGLQAY